VGILGCGALGEFLLRAIARDPSLELAFAWNRGADRLGALALEGLVPPEARLAAGALAAEAVAAAVVRCRADVVVEVCHPDVTAAAAEAVLRAGADFVVGSPTALADDALRAALVAACAARGAGLYVPAGALWGAGDIARMSARGSLRGLEVTMRKHPASLKLGGALGAALAAWLARGPPAAGEEELVLYEGPVRALCPLAPNNVNTMAAAAVAAPVTAPGGAGLYLSVSTRKGAPPPAGASPRTSTVMTCASRLASATRRATTPSKPSVSCAASAAAAIVFTLLGASGHSARTGPS